MTSCVRLLLDPGLGFPVSNGKVADFIPLIHGVRLGSEQHPWVANVPVASGVSILVRCGAVRACLMIGVDMASPEERHSRVGLRVVVYPGFSPQDGERLPMGRDFAS